MIEIPHLRRIRTRVPAGNCRAAVRGPVVDQQQFPVPESLVDDAFHGFDDDFSAFRKMTMTVTLGVPSRPPLAPATGTTISDSQP